MFHWEKFEGNFFSDPKCSGPLLQRLSLKCCLVILCSSREYVQYINKVCVQAPTKSNGRENIFKMADGQFGLMATAYDSSCSLAFGGKNVCSLPQTQVRCKILIDCKLKYDFQPFVLLSLIQVLKTAVSCLYPLAPSLWLLLFQHRFFSTSLLWYVLLLLSDITVRYDCTFKFIGKYITLPMTLHFTSTTIATVSCPLQLQ